MPSRRLGVVAWGSGSLFFRALAAEAGMVVMPSNYAIVQYRPDPASDERLNIGVIAWDADGAHAVFVDTWERVRSFGGCDIGFLREFAQSMQMRLAEDLLSGRVERGAGRTAGWRPGPQRPAHAGPEGAGGGAPAHLQPVRPIPVLAAGHRQDGAQPANRGQPRLSRHPEGRAGHTPPRPPDGSCSFTAR